jgi:hypothetical protein
MNPSSLGLLSGRSKAGMNSIQTDQGETAMKRLLFLLVLIAIGIVGLGFYRGWFKIGTDSADGNSNVTLTVNKEKFQEDKKEAVAEVHGVGNRTKDKVAEPTEMTSDGVIVSVSGSKLMMSDKAGKEHDQTLASSVKVTCDARPARLRI